jgi:T-complex protein 1 subunit eta
VQGKGQLISNINACQAVAEAVKTTLGPRGMDKLIHDGTKATISNDGAKILQLLDIVHPAAKTLVDIARAQDAEIGDGTTTVTLLAAEFLKQAKGFVEDGVHPQIIARVRRAFARTWPSVVRDRSIHDCVAGLPQSLRPSS